MIQITRLNHVPLILNSDLIEHIEVTPDTVITLTTGQRFMVLESPEEVVDRVLSFRRAIVQGGSCALLDRRAQMMVEEGQAVGEVAKANGG